MLGSTIRLDDEPYRVIGVMPEGFHFPQRGTQLWLPMRFEKGAFERRDDLYLYSVARLRRGASLESARGELTLLAARLEREYPVENKNVGASVTGLRDGLSQQSRLLLLALLGAALGVLLIACTNLASLFLARALERRQELAVRTAPRRRARAARAPAADREPAARRLGGRPRRAAGVRRAATGRAAGAERAADHQENSTRSTCGSSASPR